MAQHRYAVFSCKMCRMIQFCTDDDMSGVACTICNEGSVSFIGFISPEEILETAERIKRE